MVVLDFGGLMDGYGSDTTRTVHVGEPTAEEREVHEVVAARAAGRASTRSGPGVACQEIDRAARAVITDAGYGEQFIHRTGHGIGLTTHEPPYMIEGEEQPLEPGMCFSVEPGIYLPGPLRRPDRGHRHRHRGRRPPPEQHRPRAADRFLGCTSATLRKQPADPAAAFRSLAVEVDEPAPARTRSSSTRTPTWVATRTASRSTPTRCWIPGPDRPDARACTFPLHDPDRHPAYRVPNDRVLRWAQESDGRLYPVLPPRPRRGARRRGRALPGARGARDQASPARPGVRVRQRRGRVDLEGRRRGQGADPDPRRPRHAADGSARRPRAALPRRGAGAGARRDRRPGHVRLAAARSPGVVYDTSTFSVFDQLELFARVPAERIVFASDVPYGRPIGAMHTALRMAAYAGLDDAERAALVGGTMARHPRRPAAAGPSLPRARDPPDQRPPGPDQRLPDDGVRRRDRLRAAAGTSSRGLQFIALARASCRDPDPGAVGPALERIDGLLATAEQLMERAASRRATASGWSWRPARSPPPSRCRATSDRRPPSTDRWIPPAGWWSRKILLGPTADRDLQPMRPGSIRAILMA